MRLSSAGVRLCLLHRIRASAARPCVRITCMAHAAGRRSEHQTAEVASQPRKAEARRRAERHGRHEYTCHRVSQPGSTLFLEDPGYARKHGRAAWAGPTVFWRERRHSCGWRAAGRTYMTGERCPVFVSTTSAATPAAAQARHGRRDRIPERQDAWGAGVIFGRGVSQRGHGIANNSAPLATSGPPPP